MKKKIFAMLALVMTAMTASASAGYDLKVGTNEHGTITFKVGSNENASYADEGDEVTVTITPATGYVINEPSGQWYAAMAKAPQRRAPIDLLNAVTLNKVEGKDNQWTFTMQRANVEISCTYKKLLTNADITIADISALTYTGQAQEPTVTVKDGSTVLTLGTDYTATYSNNVNAALATATENAPTVTITAVATSELYAGETAKTFTINPATLTAATLAKTSFTYNQKEQTAQLASVMAGTLVVPEDSYDVKDNKATTVGDYTATITGKGNFTGEVTAKFSIEPADASQFVIKLSQEEYTYDGTMNTPAVTIIDGSTILTEGIDYTLTYKNNVNAGTATVMVSGIGNYTGTTNALYTIVKADINQTAPKAVTGLVYNAQAQTLIAAGSAPYGEMQYSLDGENYSTTLPTGTDAKEYSVFYKVVGDDNHNDVAAQEFKATIAPATLTAAKLAETNFIYNQQEQSAQVTSVSAGRLTVAADSYEVTGNKATNVGNYTATITGKGNFTGSATAQFSIVAANAQLFDITLSPESFTYNGEAQAPTVTVNDGATTLKEDIDYSLSITNNVNAGTATVTATGMGNYSGTKTAQFTIKTADITPTAPKAVSGLAYTAQAQTLIEAGNAIGGTMQYSLDNKNFSTTLPTGTDAKEYTVYYKVVADANHNDVAAKSINVTIEQAELTKFRLTVYQLTYNQQEQTANVNSVMAGQLEVPEDSYEVTGNKATNVGTYTATVTAKGNFKGTMTAQFNINKAKVVLTLPNAVTDLVYTGKAQTLITSGSAEGGEIQYSLDGVNYSTTLPTGTDAKDYSVYFQVIGDENHKNVAVQIIRATIARANLTAVTLAKTSFTYNQKEQTAQVTSVKAGNLTVPEDSYEVSGNKATEVGTYTVTITGKGNFKGELTAQFSIVADKAELDKTITEANAYNEEIKNDYADIATPLSEAINAAKEVQANEAATQQAVDDAVTALKAALQNAKEAVNEILAAIGTVKATSNDQWYDLNGRKVVGKPTKKSIYILNGKKVAIK